MENYILCSKLQERRDFTKLRISCHQLKIETGRYSKPKTPIEDRLCTLCSMGVIENENHMLLECPLYEPDRKLFFANVQTFYTANLDMNAETFYLLMSYNKDSELAKEVCKFVTICTNLHKDNMSPK